jgi:hypothetical protein
MTMKPGYQTTGNAHMVWSDESSSTLFPMSGRVYVYIWGALKEAYNPECLVPTVKHRGDSVMVWAATSWYCVGPNITLHGQIIARLDNHMQPMIQMLFPNKMQFPKMSGPIHTAGTVKSWFEEHLPWPAQLPGLNITEPLVSFRD